MDGINFNLVMLPEYVLFKQTVLAAVSDFPEVKARISKALRESETTQLDSKHTLTPELDRQYDKHPL